MNKSKKDQDTFKRLKVTPENQKELFEEHEVTKFRLSPAERRYLLDPNLKGFKKK